MTSQLNVDIIANKAGSGTVALHKQHALKAHVLATAAAVLDGDNDFNISSASDDGTGSYTINLTSAMSGSDYSVVGTPKSTNDRNLVFDSLTSTSIFHEIFGYNGSLADPSDGFSTFVAGDLA